MAFKDKYIFSMTGVSKMYPPNKQVLRDIYLSFYYGAKIGVLGLNGAGKSTLLKVMAGLETNINGEAKLSPGATLGYLQQEPQLDDNLTVKENVMSGMGEIVKLLKRFEEISNAFADPEMDPDAMEKLLAEQAKVQEKIEALEGWEIDRKLEIAMDALRLPPADSSVKHLSGGERRRVEVARALALDPAFLLLDEPFAGIDPIAVSDIQRMIQVLKKRQIGVLITDHNVRETLEICDLGYLLSGGMIVEKGTPAEIANSRTAKETYLGENFQF
jgi:ABC-type lipopolysaccharide export system ATPase subunit